MPSDGPFVILRERIRRRALITIAILGLTCGLVANVAGYPDLADILWSIATLPVAASLAISIIRDFIAGRFGVDAIALLAMIGALALGQPLAGAVIALMYSGGNLLEDIAVARAEKNLRTLVEPAPHVAHRDNGRAIEDVHRQVVKCSCYARPDHTWVNIVGLTVVQFLHHVTKPLPA
jgi:cation transport ATPase